MTKRFSKRERQEILDDFLRTHDGQYDPHLFKEEARNPSYPAHEWFTWDDAEAGEQHRLWQARTFVHDLRITVKIRSQHRGRVRAKTVTLPAVVSPVAGRAVGGGYVSTTTQKGQRELRREAVHDLQRWRDRYEGILLVAGIRLATVDRIIEKLRG